MRPVVLDTNIVLDLFVFEDGATSVLRDAITRGEVQWIATAAMREELVRVLAYPQVVRQRAPELLARALSAFDAHAALQPEPARAPYRCADEDDQKFIDLAVAHRALLLSKDREVLKMKNRLARVDVQTRSLYE